MLQQSAASEKLARRFAKPKRLEILFHLPKTGKLLVRLMKDRRISIVRKSFFFVVITALVLILLFPDAISETFLSVVLPLVGTVLGIPLDAGFDWIALSLVSINLLRIFPADIVSEHYQDIFEK
ncbi:MAG TPA: hypothetical protein VL461_04890 [Dictyobacter sp.]|jgi:hypothetical protein|nr:hypothetical protein [Dictyobacter sp.]